MNEQSAFNSWANSSSTPEIVIINCLDIGIYINEYSNLRTYTTFSFVVNGLMTVFLAIFGCCGNAALFRQVNSLPISHRLKTHLRVLSLWDTLLLISSFLSHGLMSVLHGVVPLYGRSIYLIYFFHPIGSFSATGTLWQVVAITVERYWAVTRPFHTQMRWCDVKWISAAVATLSIVINLPASLLETRLEKCVQVTANGTLTKHVTMGFTLLHSNPVYKLFCQFIPDLLFRCPVPFVVVAVCTAYIVHICRNRNVGDMHIAGPNRIVPIMLTLLNVKFMFCNSVYMLNTGRELIDQLSSSTDDDTTQYTDVTDETPTVEQLNNSMRHFIFMLCLTDIANIMLVIHSATNWLLFFHWTDSSTHNVVAHCDQKAIIITPEHALRLEDIIKNIGVEELGMGLLTAVVKTNTVIREALHKRSALTASEGTMDEKLREQGRTVAAFIAYTVEQFQKKHITLQEVRNDLRQIGQVHRQLSVKISNDDWKMVKGYLIDRLALTKDVCQKQYLWGSEDAVVPFISFLIAEIKTGYLCEMVQEIAATNNYTPQRRNALCTSLQTNASTYQSGSKGSVGIRLREKRPQKSCPMHDLKSILRTTSEQ